MEINITPNGDSNRFSGASRGLVYRVSQLLWSSCNLGNKSEYVEVAAA